jgi:hypothetical protein
MISHAQLQSHKISIQPVEEVWNFIRAHCGQKRYSGRYRKNDRRLRKMRQSVAEFAKIVFICGIVIIVIKILSLIGKNVRRKTWRSK